MTKLPRISCIYKIQSIIKTDRIYIGSAKLFNKRVTCHKKSLKSNKHHSKKLQNHYNKYGADDLIYSIIEPVELIDLLHREQFYMDSLNPYFNICKFAGNTLGFKQPQHVKDAVSKSKKGFTLTLEHRKKCSDSLKGRILSEEYKRKIGIKSKERMLGSKQKPRTLEQKIKISQRQIGHEVKQSTRDKLRLANLGKKQSPETIAKKTESMKLYRELKKKLIILHNNS